MEPITTGALVLASLKLVTDLLVKIPSQTQKELKEFNETLAIFETQLNIDDDHPDRDDDLLLNSRDKLWRYVQTFSKIIQNSRKG